MIFWKDADLDSVKWKIVRNSKNKEHSYCDNIFTLDTECTSAFYIDNEETVRPFQPEKSPAWYQEHCTGKVGFLYIWMLSIDDVVYYGREIEELPVFLRKIDRATKFCRKYCYIQFLQYDYQTIRSVLRFDDVFAREKRKPLRAYSDSCHFEWRDSYVLTNMSLDTLGDQYNLDVKKLTGTFDYNKLRHSETPLTDEEMAYCEHDCLTLYHYLHDIELPTYKHIKNIPMTMTGKTRNALKKMIYYLHSGNPRYALKDWRAKIEKLFLSPEDFDFCVKCYAGGYTHAQDRFTAMGTIRESKDVPINSYDFTSSYIYEILTRKVPMSRFREWKCDARTLEELVEYVDFESYAYLFEIEFVGLRCKTFNTYISSSKCSDFEHIKLDNGRVDRADRLIFRGNEHDLETIFATYKCDFLRVIKARKASKWYLPFEIQLLCVMLYAQKQKLKGVEGKEALYVANKQLLNAVYGMCVTNYITDPVEWDADKGIWYGDDMTPEEKQEKLHLNWDQVCSAVMERKGKDILWYPWGVWISSGARRHLWETIIKIDKDVMYCDTDSIKSVGFHDVEIEESNKKSREEIRKFVERANEYLTKKGIKEDFEKNYCEITFDLLKDLGSFDHDASYSEFRTLGAKKYCYRYNKEFAIKEAEKKSKKSGKTVNPDFGLHITVSGVNKKTGVKSLNDNIDNFTIDHVFDYESSGRKIRFYCDNQPEVIKVVDYLGNYKEVRHQPYATCLQPTTYVLGVSDDYGNRLEEITDASIAYHKCLETYGHKAPHCEILCS